MNIKKQLKQIRKGNRDALLEWIDYALDEYHENAYQNGYKSFQADSEVHAQRIADKLLDKSVELGVTSMKDSYFLTVEETAKVINEYLINEI
jgi:L-lactate utilization protein LutB